MTKTVKLFFIILIFLCTNNVNATALKKISIDFQQEKLSTILYTLAKDFQQNIVVNSNIDSLIDMHLHDIEPRAAFELVLTANELTKSTIGNTWFISSHKELYQRKQKELKLKELLHETNPLITRVWQIHYAKAEEIAKVIQENNNTFLSKRGHLRIDARTNTLCVQDTSEFIFAINQMIKRLDVPVPQVLIAVRLASVDNDFERELGIHFAITSQKPGLVIAKLADAAWVDLKLTALESEGHGELISSPSLFTANQQPASIEAGEEIPYQEVSKSGATSVAFKKAVLSLKVTPQVLPNQKISLQLQVTQDKPNNRIVLGVPAIMTRQISTNVLVKSGQTIVLGGIYESNKEIDHQRLPFINKIPFIGWLFQEKSTLENKRELLIFVTPKIVGQE